MRRFLLAGILVAVMLLCACRGQTASGGTEEQGLVSDIFGGLTESKKGVSESVIPEDIMNEGWGDYHYYGHQDDLYDGEMELVSWTVDRRMTDETKDEIYAVVEMADDQFTKTSYLKLSYLNYTEGGWNLETIESYEPTVFRKVGEPQEDAINNLISGYYSGYTLDHVEGEDTLFHSVFNIDEAHTNCHYSGTVTVDMELVSVGKTEVFPESCHWNSTVGDTDVTVDWSNACGTYVDEDQWNGLVWDKALFYLFMADGSLACNGEITGVTHCSSETNYYGASWDYESNIELDYINKMEYPGTQPVVTFSSFLTNGQPFRSDYDEGIDLDAFVDSFGPLYGLYEDLVEDNKKEIARIEREMQDYIDYNNDISELRFVVYPDHVSYACLIRHQYIDYENHVKKYGEPDEIELVKIS